MNVKRDIITIGGRPGSGKSTVSKAAAAELGFGHFSSGDLMRKLGEERGLKILDTNRAAETDDTLDRLVDGSLIEIGQSGRELVIDSRMAWHWMPEAMKVFLDLDLQVAAQRIIDSADEERRVREHIPDDPEEYAAQLEARLASESKRYKSKYGVDPYNVKNYDLVVDTHSNDRYEVTARVVGGYTVWIAS